MSKSAKILIAGFVAVALAAVGTYGGAWAAPTPSYDYGCQGADVMVDVMDTLGASYVGTHVFYWDFDRPGWFAAGNAYSERYGDYYILTKHGNQRFLVVSPPCGAGYLAYHQPVIVDWDSREVRHDWHYFLLPSR